MSVWLNFSDMFLELFVLFMHFSFDLHVDGVPAQTRFIIHVVTWALTLVSIWSPSRVLSFSKIIKALTSLCQRVCDHVDVGDPLLLFFKLAHSYSMVRDRNLPFLLLIDRGSDHFTPVTSHRCMAYRTMPIKRPIVVFLWLIHLWVLEIIVRFLIVASCLLLINKDLLTVIRESPVMVRVSLTGHHPSREGLLSVATRST